MGDDGDIVTHVWDANNTWMFKSMSPKFGHEKFMGQLPGTVTEMNKPEYSSVGPGYYRPKYARENEIPNPGMKPTLTTTNNKICAIRDNGIHRMDYRTGFELGRIGETLKNPMLSPCGYEPDEKINIAYIAFPDRDSVMDQTDVRFKPTPVADEDVQINLEMETGALMRESPALSMDRAGWTMQGCPLETQSRGLLPKTPAPHCRRSASCPPNPDQYLKKGEGMTLTQGITLCRAQRHAKQRSELTPFSSQLLCPDVTSVLTCCLCLFPVGICHLCCAYVLSFCIWLTRILLQVPRRVLQHQEDAWRSSLAQESPQVPAHSY